MSTTHRQFKDSVYEQLARPAKAASAPKRLEMLDLLSQGPSTVENLAANAGITVANASQHLKVLRGARLVESRKDGLYVEYRLADEEVAGFFLALRKLAHSRLAEMEQVTRDYFQGRAPLEGIAGAELLRRVKRGQVTVLDVRPSEEFVAGHIHGALSIPVGELKARLKELPQGKEIAAYCRGPYCVMAVEAVELLRKKGFTAHRMELGVVEWRAGGGRVDTGLQGARP